MVYGMCDILFQRGEGGGLKGGEGNSGVHPRVSTLIQTKFFKRKKKNSDDCLSEQPRYSLQDIRR